MGRILLNLRGATQFVGLLTHMSSDCIPPSQVSPMTRFRGKDTFSILTAPRHKPPCSGFAPDSLVQQNKNACPPIAHRVAHLPQSKPEYRNRCIHSGGNCSQCRHENPNHGGTGAINTNRRIFGHVIIFHAPAVWRPEWPGASAQAAFFLPFSGGRVPFDGPFLP